MSLVLFFPSPLQPYRPAGLAAVPLSPVLFFPSPLQPYYPGGLGVAPASPELFYPSPFQQVYLAGADAALLSLYSGWLGWSQPRRLGAAGESPVTPPAASDAGSPVGAPENQETPLVFSYDGIEACFSLIR